jgi:hypothetical protein
MERGKMTDDEFSGRCWRCNSLRRYIVCQASRRSKRKEVQEDLIQEAWLVISTLPRCHGKEECKNWAEKAIYSGYWQENKERLMLNTLDKPPHLRHKGTPGNNPDGCYQAIEERTDRDPNFLKRFNKDIIS